MTNSISQWGGIPDNSSGNTSRYSLTMGTSSGFSTFRLWMVGSGRLDLMWQVTVFPRWFVMVTVLSAQAMFPRHLVSQAIPRITSIPWKFNTTRLVGNTTPLRLIGMLITPKWHGMWPPGDLVIRGRFKATVGISGVSTKCEEMKEWKALESKSIVARKDWIRNSLSTTLGASSASSAYTWLTLAFPKDDWVLASAPRVIPVICFNPLTELEMSDGVAFLYGQLAMKCQVSLQLKQAFGLVTWLPPICYCWKDP
jgi:hypothetical protein